MEIINRIKSWKKKEQIEKRIFIIALFVTFPYFGSSILFDFVNNSALIFKILDISLLLICMLLLYMSRNARLLWHVIHFFCFIIISGSVFYWTISGGIRGGGAYVFIVVAVLVIVMSHKKLQLLFTLILVLAVILITSNWLEISDHKITYGSLLFDFGLNLIVMSVLLIVFRLALDEEVGNLRKQNQEINKLNNHLDQRSIELKEYNSEIKMLQENLEDVVKQRSELLEEQRKEDIEYAFINAHLIRAPIANIIGLSEILEKNHPQITELKKNVIGLDQTVRRIGKVLSTKE